MRWMMGFVIAFAMTAGAETRIASISTEPPAGRYNAAALEFAKTQGAVTLLRWDEAGGWRDADGHLSALEMFDVVWFHQGDDPAQSLGGDDAVRDVFAYLKAGGALLLSGAAGRVLNDAGVEPTPVRLLYPSPEGYASGMVVREAFRSHPAFAGLDSLHTIPLTRFGGTALADFYGTEGPHGDILAEGNAGVGERPVVEYTVGAGKAVMVGWRLADFTTADDPYRPNLERFFGNLLQYLAGRNTNRARMHPAENAKYVRSCDIPFMLTSVPTSFALDPRDGTYVALLFPIYQVPEQGHVGVHELALQVDEQRVDAPLTVDAFGATQFAEEKPVTRRMAALQAEQDAFDTQDRERLKGVKTIAPDVTFQDAPLKPLREHPADRSVLLGRSPFMAPGDGLGDASMPVYEPVEDGGFRVANGKRILNRPIVFGQNRVWTGDAPLFSMDTVTGNGSYAANERVYPLWPRPDAQVGNINPAMGQLQLGVANDDGSTSWLEKLDGVVTTFRPGYTGYEISTPTWKASIRVAPVLESHGFICRVAFDKPVRLACRYGGVWWSVGEKNANHAEIRGNSVRITEANLPNNLVLAGWNGEGDARVVAAPYGDQVEFTAREARVTYAIAAIWGVTAYDEPRAKDVMARVDTPNAAAWPEARDRLKAQWFDCYIGRALDPVRRFEELLAAPEAALDRTCAYWDARRAEFQIHTPDARLNALINWSRCTTDYHRQGPGLVLGGQIWQMYSHISTGWYGKEWGGDHATIEDTLRFYAAMQGDDGFVRWISPSLVAFDAENNTPYWVDQVWRHFTWTGDAAFVRDMWPAVRKAVAWQRAKRDPDGDGLFQDFYEYWNCDSNGKGPKSVVPSAMSWRMLECAANLARVAGDVDAETEYRALAAMTREAVFRELWREGEGRLGCVGADGLWRGHPQTWEEYLPILAGLLEPEQGRRAMRWLESHYGFEPQSGVRLLACSDWYPTRWSVQWVPTGDTCLAALAGIRCGDVAQWYPYLATAIGSAFRSDAPGINMGIGNTGAGGGDREDVDSVDPYTHAVVRGVFGIEPALDEGRLDICPAFPAEWTEASIATPDVRYTYKRDGGAATFSIVTPKPCIKRVRANLTGAETVTPDEMESTVTVAVGAPVAPPEPAKEPPILITAFKKETARIADVDRARLVLVDLSKACNRTVESMIADRYVYDYAPDKDTATVDGWWGNPRIVMPPSPRAVEAPNGVLFLTAGRPRGGVAPNGLVALSSWRPYPLPGGATIPVGMRCARAWLLLQSYTHPMKNYVTNGEIVPRYADGHDNIVPLIPPYNLDAYFQHFSLEGVPVPMGRLAFNPGWSFVHQGLSNAHADALEIPCDPASPLESIELRATCSEGVLGLAGLTFVTPASATTAAQGALDFR